MNRRSFLSVISAALALRMPVWRTVRAQDASLPVDAPQPVRIGWFESDGQGGWLPHAELLRPPVATITDGGPAWVRSFTVEPVTFTSGGA